MGVCEMLASVDPEQHSCWPEDLVVYWLRLGTLEQILYWKSSYHSEGCLQNDNQCNTKSPHIYEIQGKLQFEWIGWGVCGSVWAGTLQPCSCYCAPDAHILKVWEGCRLQLQSCQRKLQLHTATQQLALRTRTHTFGMCVQACTLQPPSCKCNQQQILDAVSGIGIS